MSKNSPSENVENNNVKKRRLSFNLNQPIEEMRPPIVHALQAAGAPKLKLSKASELLQDEHVIHHEESGYCNNFYPKKFTNKQALGGHQNAHKFEKAPKKGALEGQEGSSIFTCDGSSNGSTLFAFPNSFSQDLKMRKPQPLQLTQQMNDHDFPGFISPMSHESSLNTIPDESSIKKLDSLCASPISPKVMSFQEMMEQGTSTSNGKSIYLAENDHSAESQHQENEDDIDLTLKL